MPLIVLLRILLDYFTVFYVIHLLANSGRIYLHLCVVNTSTQTTITGDSWALQINKNSFGLAPHSASALGLPDLIPGQQAETSVLLDPNVNLSQTPPAHPLTLQVR